MSKIFNFCFSAVMKEMELNSINESGAYTNPALSDSTVSIQTPNEIRGSDEFICKLNSSYDKITNNPSEHELNHWSENTYICIFFQWLKMRKDPMVY